MASTRSSAFAELLRETITDVSRRTGKLKKELARDCGVRPDRLSHLQNGLRRPALREVMSIARGLRLDERSTHRLLEAAGFDPLSGHEIAPSSTTALLTRLPEPEQSVARAEAERDERTIAQSWNHYVSVRGHRQVGEWSETSQPNTRGDDLYWELQALAVRFRAQLYLADATSLHYSARYAEAESKCSEGLVWAEDVANARFRVMLLSRLASIKHLQSDYEEADRRFAAALAVLDAWERDDSGMEADRDARQAWREHWRARIQRKQGLVELFKGRPVAALERMMPAFHHFRRSQQHHDELSRVLYGIGWACSLRGEFEQAKSWNQQGLEHARAHIEHDGQEDARLLFQGHLHLGGNYLDLNEPRSARTELEQALQYGRRRRLAHYHEVGWAHRLMAKLEMKEGAWDRAHEHLQAALGFYSSHEERVLQATVHNAMGDFYLARPGVAHRHRALDYYLKALDLARSSRPRNTYYECASLLNIARARVRTGVPDAGVRDQRGVRGASEAGWRFEDLVEKVKQVGQTHHYRNHLARLAVVEAEFALVGGDEARAHAAAGTALHLGNNFSPFLLAEVREALARLGLPHELLAVTPTISDEAP